MADRPGAFYMYAYMILMYVCMILMCVCMILMYVCMILMYVCMIYKLHGVAGATPEDGK